MPEVINWVYEQEWYILDYLEGLLLGRLWSDTDYENRRHFGLFVLYGLFVDAIVLYIYILNKGLLGFGSIGPIHISVFVLLMALAAIVIPSLIYLGVKLVQYVWDWVVNTLIIKRFFPTRK